MVICYLWLVENLEDSFMQSQWTMGVRTLGLRKKQVFPRHSLFPRMWSDVGYQLFIRNSFWQKSGRLQTLTSSRFLRVQKVTSSLQNISEGPVWSSLETLEILAVLKCQSGLLLLSQVLSWHLRSKVKRFFTCVEEHLRAANTRSLALQSSLSDEQGKHWMYNRSISLLINELFFFFKCSARKLLSLGFKYDLKFNVRYLMHSTTVSVFCSRHHLENLLHNIALLCFPSVKKDVFL